MQLCSRSFFSRIFKNINGFKTKKKAKTNFLFIFSSFFLFNFSYKTITVIQRLLKCVAALQTSLENLFSGNLLRLPDPPPNPGVFYLFSL